MKNEYIPEGGFASVGIGDPASRCVRLEQENAALLAALKDADTELRAATRFHSNDCRYCALIAEVEK